MHPAAAVVRPGPCWGKLYSFCKVRLRQNSLFLRMIAAASCVVALRRLRSKFDGLCKIRYCLVVIIFIQIGYASEIPTSPFWIKFDRFRVVGDRKVVLTLPYICTAPVDIGVSNFRIDLDRTVKVGDRQVVFALLQIPIAPAEVFRSTLRIKSDRLCLIGDRLVKFPVQTMNVTASVIRVLKSGT